MPLPGSKPPSRPAVGSSATIMRGHSGSWQTPRAMKSACAHGRTVTDASWQAERGARGAPPRVVGGRGGRRGSGEVYAASRPGSQHGDFGEVLGRAVAVLGQPAD